MRYEHFADFENVRIGFCYLFFDRPLELVPSAVTFRSLCSSHPVAMLKIAPFERKLSFY